MVQIYYRMDSVILQFLKGTRSVGLYTAVYQLILLGESIAVLYFTAMLPRISWFWKHDREKLSVLLGFSISIFATAGGLLGLLGTLFSNEIVKLIYGINYQPSHWALGILIWSMVITYIALTPAYFLMGTQYQRDILHATIIAAMVNLILNFPLIIYYGIYGAALATVISKFAEMAYLYMKSGRKICLNWGKDKTIKLAGAVIITLSAGIISRISGFVPVLTAVLICAVYALLIFSLKVLSIRGLKRSMELIGT
jgi:O-antigen/teichoic acid export membrane protein